ncbi:hypothetical protein FQR65_LT18572 [Abscondita terminalis]|nr:hypothetical protein FQR65_LT18572 [Abscondita terminalis]
MLKEVRLQKLLDYLKENADIVPIEKISLDLNIPLTTLRRDLQILEEKNDIIKSHGAVKYNDSNNLIYEDLLELKIETNVEEKKAIAKKAIELIQKNQTVFLDSGSSTYYIAEQLNPNLNLKIVTNSIYNVLSLRKRGHNSVYILGGQFKEVTGAILGYESILALKNYNFDVSFIGVNAIDNDGDIYTTSPEHGQIKIEIIKHSQKSYGLADSKKGETMIYTITLNPAIDYIIRADEIKGNQTNYYKDSYEQIGGKGINVSIILNRLNDEVTSTGILGKIGNDLFLNKFKELNLKNNFFLFDGKTRTNFKIKNLSINEETELNGVTDLQECNSVEQLISFLKENVNSDDLIIAGGSLPSKVSQDIYQEIGQICLDKNIKFILDTSKEYLVNGLKAKPYLIKPNLEELCDILKIEHKTYSYNEIEKFYLELKNKGAQNMLLSMGKDGSYFFSQDGSIYQVSAIKGTLVNSVGAGDSMVAGFIHGLVNNLTIEETLQFASASGAATAFTE